MKVIYIRPAKSSGYLSVGIMTDEEEKRAFVVSEEDYAEAGAPMTADELSPSAYTLIAASDERYRARMAALRILSYADNNERSLIRKLVGKGISYATAEDVAHEMVGRGYINEQKQLMRLVAYEANTALSGPRKIRAKLSLKGYKTADIECAMDELTSSGEVDFERSAAALREKKLTRGATEEEIKKLLYKYGYSIC